MIYRLRRGIIGPLAIIWLTATVASVVIGGVAWSRFSRSIDASADAAQLHAGGGFISGGIRADRRFREARPGGAG